MAQTSTATYNIPTPTPTPEVDVDDEISLSTPWVLATLSVSLVFFIGCLFYLLYASMFLWCGSTEVPAHASAPEESLPNYKQVSGLPTYNDVVGALRGGRHSFCARAPPPKPAVATLAASAFRQASISGAAARLEIVASGPAGAQLGYHWIVIDEHPKSQTQTTS